MGWYRYVNALSLDVVAGSVISALFFARVLAVNMPKEILASLALAVWVIYTFDHLWDARRSKHPLLTFRHRMHQKHFIELALATTAGILLGAFMIPKLPIPTIYWGMGVLCFVLIYFLVTGLLKTSGYHKELFIAFIYTGGVLAGPLSLTEDTLSLAEIILMVQFTLLAFVNLLVFAYYESEMDRLQEFPSLLITIGPQKSKYLILGTLLMIAIASLVLAMHYMNDSMLGSSFLVVLLMSVILALVFLFPGVFGTNERFRFVGDAIFFVPLLVI